MRRLLVLLALGALLALTQAFAAGHAGGASATVIAGLALLVGHVSGWLFAAIGLPRVTGYLGAGLALGPQVSGVISVESAGELHFLSELAVAFIALAAGAELRLAELRDRLRVIASLTATVAIIVVPSVGLLVYVGRGLLPFTSGFDTAPAAAVALLIGAMAIARSPSSALAVIRETESRGPFTETSLGVTVALDVISIVIFAICLSVCEAVLTPGAGLDLAFVGSVTVQIVAGVLFGVVLGGAIAFYIARAPGNLALVLLGTALVVTEVAHGTAAYMRETHDLPLQLEPLLICVTAGFTVRNFSPGGRRFAEAVESVSLPVFVLFFTLTGAGLDLDALRATWPTALLLVGSRAATVLFSSWLGGRLVGEGVHSRLYGLTLLTQAGVSLGLTMEVVRRFPEWGDAFAAVVVAAISVNQVIGPVAMKFALQRSGEAGAAHRP